MDLTLAIFLNWAGLVVALIGCVVTPGYHRKLSLFYPLAAAAFIYAIGRQMMG